MRRTVLSSLAAAALVLGSGQLASAESTAQTPPAGDSSTVSKTAELAGGEGVDSRRAALEVEKYWTAERMAQAIPADNFLPAPPGSGKGSARKAGPTGKPGTTPAAAPAKKSKTGARVADSAAVGKVFFKNPADGKNYVCSAASINSPSKQMVTTAGHCVNGGGTNGTAGQWMQNWTYVPRYRDGVRPFGTFAAKQFRTFTSWTNNSDLARDVAMVTTWPLNNNKVVNVTGGHGLSWNFSQNQATTVFGYPGNHNNGQVQWVCQGTTRAAGASYSELQCNFGGGSSGGPWLRTYSEANGLGSQNGVMSTISGGGWNQTPYFDNAVKQMFDDQGSVT
ncbi:hypothetical protein [Streptomyces sp. NPDC014894]|uniref:hypothetical protein n=1 Tax=unclassified Streptomyces TaxID=2593676 RepID=UPI0036FB397C